ncbi:MAG: S8 family serine peptidase [Candidatus Heimdallarchaeota archaeon]|nr:S8 family serine peptidase [Candidatus Heimdallarchaeota archaeon]
MKKLGIFTIIIMSLAMFAVIVPASADISFSALDAKPSKCTPWPACKYVDTEAPTVAISDPSDGSTVSGVILVTATASDNQAMDRVEFYIDGGFISSDSSAPYTMTWDTTAYADGSHYITAMAYDASSNSASDIAYYTVDNSAPVDTEAPVVAITAPTPGTVSDTVVIIASASDNFGVDRVEFSVDGLLKYTDYSAPYEFSWDTTTVSDADHTVTAEAFDAAGNSASDSNVYTVDNGGVPPVGCGESPRVAGQMPFWNDAIDVEKGHAAGCYGGDAVVVVLDTGLNRATYPSLFPSGAINTQYSRSFTMSGGYDSVDWDEDTTEGHGTSVTATVLGYYVPSTWGFTNNYVQGVAPNAELIMGRIVYWVGAGVTYDQMVYNWADAINYYVNLHNQGTFGTKGMVISMSLGYDEALASSSANNALVSAFTNARASGVAMSTSAGNDGPNPNTTGYPANIDAATSVAAAGWNGYTGSYGVEGIRGDIPEDDFSGLLIADFSSRGKVDITGMGWQLALPSQDGGIYYISGTSFSCPQVSGVFALMFSYYGAISVDALEGYMFAGAYYAGVSTTWGAGFVQVDGALGI